MGSYSAPEDSATSTPAKRRRPRPSPIANARVALLLRELADGPRWLSDLPLDRLGISRRERDAAIDTIVRRRLAILRATPYGLMLVPARRDGSPR